MKPAFLIAVFLLFVPITVSASEQDQPSSRGAIVRDATPSAQTAPAAPAIRKKVRHPAAEAPAPPPAFEATPAPKSPAAKAAPSPEQIRKRQIVAAYRDKAPREWGERVEGVRTRLDTAEPVIALTLDACGGPRGGRADTVLIEYLQRERIPATLFVSGSWIDANAALFRKLAADPLFEIGNHGLSHRPCSVNGRSAYGIRGTGSVAELVDEIEKNSRKIEAATGQRPKFYRPGTAYCDEVAVTVAVELGYEVVNYTVLGDAGATWPREKVRDALLRAGHGAIVILHMNQPRSGTAAGVMDAMPLLRQKGFRFVKLSEYPLR